MTSFEAHTDIDADPSTVWATLTDLARYPDWDSGVVSIDGDAALGARLRLVSEVDPTRTFKLRVAELSAPSVMVWTGGMPLGLFRGVRTDRLTPSAAGTRVHLREEFSGPMSGMITRSMPDLQPSFDQFVRGLKAEVEGAPS